MSKQNMRASVRKRIEKKGLYAIVKSGLSPMVMGAIVLGAALIAICAIWFLFLSNYAIGDDDFAYEMVFLVIVGALLIIHGGLQVVIDKRSIGARKEGMALLTDHYKRPLEEILQEIEAEIKTADEIPATNGGGFINRLSGTERVGYFTKNWYIAPRFERFVKYTDIITVVEAGEKGVEAKGTYIIPTHGDILWDMFGKRENRDRLFGIIQVANPYMLSPHDTIELNGQAIGIYQAIDRVTSDTPLVEDSKTMKAERAIVLKAMNHAFSNKQAMKQ